MQKWEYKVLTHAFLDELEGTLNALGKKGWELVSCETSDAHSRVRVVVKRINRRCGYGDEKMMEAKSDFLPHTKIKASDLMSTEDVLVKYGKYTPEEAARIAAWSKATTEKLQETKKCCDDSLPWGTTCDMPSEGKVVWGPAPTVSDFQVSVEKPDPLTGFITKMAAEFKAAAKKFVADVCDESCKTVCGEQCKKACGK